MDVERLQERLLRASSWRKKELLQLRTDVASSGGPQRSVRLRVLAAMSYAHWEGFVKSAGQLYFDYLLSKKHSIEQLNDNLLAVALSKLVPQESSKASYYLPAADFILA